MNKIASCVRLILLSLCLTACAAKDIDQPSAKEDAIELSKPSHQERLDSSSLAKKHLIQYEEIEDVRAIHSDQFLLIAIDIKQHDRFSLESIESSLKEQLKEDFPNLDLTLSSDQKLFIEIEALEKEVAEKNLSEEALNKRLKALKKLSKEET